MHPYTCERCNQPKKCAITGCAGDCAKVCVPCIRRGARGRGGVVSRAVVGALAVLVLAGCAAPIGERAAREQAERETHNHTAAERAANPRR